ncbi:amino acid adenylation domain-containing protein [Streptomyces sp. NPDC060333]|uniref:non-ribosomal peptide synthetase n=1 Tax=Streptomyces sp. NPDC060333 TaxID=3347098 RepID=UPI00364C5EAD
MNNIEDIYPLSPAQEGMLFHSTTSPEHGLYVELTTFRVSGDLDVEGLTAAWQAAAARHPVLRTAFVHERISAPRQVVLPTAEVPVDFRDLSHLDGAARDTEIAGELDRRRREPFDLTRPPLMRLLVLRLPDEHLLVWTYHHLLLDGWSAALLMAEVTATLGGADPGRPAPPPFRDHIAWLRDQDADRDREFWTGHLAGYREPATLTLPGTRPGARPSGDYRRVSTTLPAGTTDRLRALAASRSTTLGSVVEAAWAGTLARYSGKQDVVFGVTVSGRPAGLERAGEMIGMFINTVATRARIDPELPAEAWLSRYAQARHPILEHQHTPLTDVQRWAGLQPGVALFDSVVVFENYPDESRAVLSGGAVITDVRYETRTNYAVTLVVRTGEETHLQAIVDSARFDEGEAEALLAHVAAVLTRFADRPQTPVGELLAVPEPVRALQLDRWNGTDIDRTPPRAFLADLIGAAVRDRPDHPAVVAGSTTYDYRALDARATALALRLVDLGVRAGDRVAVCLGRGADLVTALLGVARAGAAFVPLDPSHPADRIAYVLKDAAPTLVLTDGTPLPGPDSWNGAVLDLSRESLARGAGEGGTRPDPTALPDADPDGLAYLIYTSGSTGNPKGVAVGHRALANLVDSLAFRHPGLTAEDRFLALTTLTFDTSLAELLVPLAVGATVHVGHRSLGLSGTELDRYVERHGITALQATPSRYRALLDSGWQGVDRPRLYSCGEAFPPDLTAPLTERGSSVWNMYGPTETTVYSSVEEIRKDTVRVTVGRPLSNTVLRVLDPADGLLPIGCVGELCIGGDGVAEGYWNLPELTAERFVGDPFTGGRTRMFRTGDHARVLPDGRVEVLGRIDRQLKLRGYRIEPSEIEAVLLDLTEVAGAAVAVRDGRLVAWTVPADRSAVLEPSWLAGELRRRLPSYMIPETFVGLAELPMTPAGKTDLLALRAPLPAPEGTPDAPAPEVAGTAEARGREELIAKLFRDVLSLPEVGLDDDFFELGGDSLRAMRLASKLQAELGAELDIELFFDASTVRELTAALAEALPESG